MRIFNEEKTQEIFSPDLSEGRLKEDKLFVAHHDAVAESKEIGHWETVREYANGGKDVAWVIDAPAAEACEAYDEYEDIFVYIPYTEEELCARAADVLRARRAAECFPVVNRGALWYDKLTAEQLAELSVWYEGWLDAPATDEAPDEPAWLNDIK